MSRAPSTGSEKNHRGAANSESAFTRSAREGQQNHHPAMKSAIWVPILCGVFLLPSSAFAQLYIGLGIRVGPPPPPTEVIVERPHRNWVWVPGYYRWIPRHQRYAWVRGHWVRPPYAHAVWIAPRWEERNGEWVYSKGRWDHEARRNAVTRRR